MPGYCKDCGKLLKADGKCPDQDCLQARPPIFDRGLGPLPKPSTARRLLGSGIEFLVYATCNWAITALDTVTGIAGLLSLVLVVLVVLRDFNGGAFSIAKRVSQMRVVDHRTGQAASNLQAFGRNSYYLVLLLVGVFPLIDWISSSFFMVFMALDVMMIMASPQGRRLGDLLAGTQVVAARSRL